MSRLGKIVNGRRGVSHRRSDRHWLHVEVTDGGQTEEQ